MPRRKEPRVLNATFFIVCIVSVVILFIASRFCSYKSDATDYEKTATATVIKVLDIKENSLAEWHKYTEVVFSAKVTSGPHKGTEIEMTQNLDEMFLPVPKMVEKGDKVLALETLGNDGMEWVYYGTNRVGGIIWTVVIFLLMILLIGHGKGFATIVSLLLTVGAIFYVYIPSILRGHNVYATTIVVSVYIVVVSLILLNGFNKKTLCAMVGNIGGMLIAGLLALIFNRLLGITGVLDEDYVFLMMLEGDVAIDLKAVVWSGILIGSLGAIMDVAMSIASAMHELSEQMGRKSFGRLVRSGMRIGRDAIGTMTNTLILAYVGGSLAVILLFTAYNKNTLVVLNLEMIVVEVVQAVVGSMGILIAVPLTVFFSAALYKKQWATKERTPLHYVNNSRPNLSRRQTNLPSQPKRPQIFDDFE